MWYRKNWGAKVQVAKRNELHTFTVIPQRWIVERSFGWLEQSRRLWKNSERLLNTSLQFMHLAFLSLLLKRLRTASKTLRIYLQCACHWLDVWMLGVAGVSACLSIRKGAVKRKEAAYRRLLSLPGGRR
jgi:hypothetical protein